MRFFPDQRVQIGADPGTWVIERGELRITCVGWDGEGALGVDCLYLLASPGGDHRARRAWVCDFTEDPRQRSDRG